MTYQLFLPNCHGSRYMLGIFFFPPHIHLKEFVEKCVSGKERK